MSLTSAPAEILLRPGDCHYGSGAVRLVTLLGSCVAITLWHGPTRQGGMCHFMLPQRCGAEGGALDGRFAPEALALLAQHAKARGVRLQQHEARVYGGACPFGRSKAGESQIGARNVAAALALLARHAVAVHAQHVLGVGYRNLELDLRNGAIRMRHGTLTDAT